MSEVKWIKIATNIFDNQKIKIIESMPEGDTIIVIWFKILMLAGEVNDSGLVYFTKDIPYTEQTLATVFNRPLATIQLALSTFEQFGMIEIVNDMIYVSNWQKYQNVEGMERIREQNRIRKQNQREREKQARIEMSRDSHVTVTQSHATDIDIEVDKEIEKSKEPKRKRFVPPTLEEVQNYCKERNSNVDPKKFFEYYSTGDWKDSKGNPVKNWKQKLITWEKKDDKPKPKEQGFQRNDIDYDALRKQVFAN